MDLDLSLSPDAFGLWAFDSSQPLTRMLPGSSPYELRLMLPDGGMLAQRVFMMLLSKTWQRLLPVTGHGISRRGRDFATSTMAAVCFLDHATMCERGGAAPSVGSPSSGVAFST